MDNTSLPFTITTGSAAPIYRQLMDQVLRRIASGLWQAGDELPSVRELAQALAVNPMTVSKAYSLLEAQGALERRRGQSMVVAAGRSALASATDRAELLRPTLERAASEARQLDLSDAQALALFESILQHQPPGEPA